MPEATATGANTFGCLVDGWVSVSGRWGLPVAEFTQLEDSTGMTISAQIGFDSYLRFSIPNPKQGETLPYTNVSFDNQKSEMEKSTLPGCLTGYSAGLLRETVLQKDAST